MRPIPGLCLAGPSLELSDTLRHTFAVFVTSPGSSVQPMPSGASLRGGHMFLHSRWSLRPRVPYNTGSFAFKAPLVLIPAKTSPPPSSHTAFVPLYPWYREKIFAACPHSQSQRGHVFFLKISYQNSLHLCLNHPMFNDLIECSGFGLSGTPN
jgi:hypothetical protein